MKIVAHKARHKTQDKWEPEEYVVIEQPIAGTPVYKVKPVTVGNVGTLHRNLLLPFEPDYKSDDSLIVTRLYGKRKNLETSKDESLLVEKKKIQSKGEKHVEFDSELDIFPDTIVSPESMISKDSTVSPITEGKETVLAEPSDSVLVESSVEKSESEDNSHPSLETLVMK